MIPDSKTFIDSRVTSRCGKEYNRLLLTCYKQNRLQASAVKDRKHFFRGIADRTKKGKTTDKVLRSVKKVLKSI